MSARRNILLSAYACEPDKGSEPGVGWNWVEQAGRFHEVWVLTRANNRPAIEKSGAEWVQRVHWIYYDLPRLLRFWKKGSRGTQLYYYLWQIGAYFETRKWFREVSFDLVHHVTFGRYWTPSWLGLFPIPFVFGPVGGGEDTPEGLLSRNPKHKRHELIRSFFRKLSKFDPILRRTLKKAAVVSATEETARKVECFHPRRHFVQAQCGLSREDIAFFKSLKPGTGTPFRLISIGRLVQWKGYHLSVAAFAKLLEFHPQAEYWLLNGGPELPALETLAKDAGCGLQIKFWGRLPTLRDVYSKLEQSDVLVHPALHEAFGNVCLESMASGRPVICLNRGGPGLQVTPETGIAIEPGNEEETVEALLLAMRRLAEDVPLRLEMGRNARARAYESFAWDRLGERMNEIYLGV